MTTQVPNVFVVIHEFHGDIQAVCTTREKAERVAADLTRWAHRHKEHYVAVFPLED